MSAVFDVVVIGAGPGGYIAAIRAAQLGLKVACVDRWLTAAGKPAPGGTCTNVGCIPSKALLQSSEHFEAVTHDLPSHGIKVESCSLDLDTMLGRKAKIVAQNNEGILFLFKKNKVTFHSGSAAFAGREGDLWQIEVTPSGADQTPLTLSARHVVVATGSVPRALPQAPFDEDRILSNDGALSIPAVPQHLGVIGAGVIGLEMGSVWRRLGATVTLLEAAPAFLGAADAQIAKEALKLFTQQGLSIHLGVKIDAINSDGKGVSVTYADQDGKQLTQRFDRLIVSIGRLPCTDGLKADQVGLALDARGFVEVDEACRSNLPNVWAVGDVVRGPMLAHKAEEEGVAVAERIAGQHGHVDLPNVPWVIYTAPEIAWVGQTEQALRESGRAIRVGSFPFMANGRARALGHTAGMVKVIADEASDEVLGVHIIGPSASELIAEAVMAMTFKASSEDIGRICHAHPSLSEATKEAALAVDKRALNF